MKTIATAQGFSAMFEKGHIRCSRFSAKAARKAAHCPEKNRQSCDFTDGELRVGRVFSLKLESSQKAKRSLEKIALKSRARFRETCDDNAKVSIVPFCCKHSNNCNPNSEQQTMCRSRSGNHISSINETAMLTLRNMMKFNNSNLSNTAIKSVLQLI